MKICVFADIHANFDALNKLFYTDDFKSSDVKICLGDVVINGPHPNECCKAVLDNNCIWLMGNRDSYIANGLPEEEYKHFKQDKIDHQNYMCSVVKDKYKQIMKNLPKKHLITIGGKKLYFTHYIWETWDNVVDTPEIPTAENIADIFKDVDADYIFYGHEHHASHFKGHNKEFVCVGSLGMIYPGHYTIVDIDENDIHISHKTINFDLDEFKQDILSANYPQAEEYVKSFNHLS